MLERAVDEIMRETPLPLDSTITPAVITKDPWPFLRFNYICLRTIDDYNDQQDEEAKVTKDSKDVTHSNHIKTFAITPQYSLIRQHITIDITGLKQILNQAGLKHHILAPDTELPQHQHNTAQFNAIFNIDKIKNQQKVFTNMMLTDGLSASLTFAKRMNDNDRLPFLEPEDFDAEDMEKHFKLWGVDPGERDVFNASDGMGTTRHQLRSFSRKEYYDKSGINKSQKKIIQYKKEEVDGVSIENLESRLSSHKTSSYQKLLAYVISFNDVLQQLLGRYDSRFTLLRFLNYQGKQRMQAEMVNIFIDGGNKYRHTQRRTGRRKRKARQKRIG